MNLISDGLATVELDLHDVGLLLAELELVGLSMEEKTAFIDSDVCC